MKKGFLQTLSIFSILMMNFVSASFHYGYNRFSFRGLIDNFDPVVLSLSILFIIFLLVLHKLVFINLFRGQIGPALTVSTLVSFLSVYWMYQRGYFLEEAVIFPLLVGGVIFGLISLILVKGFKVNKAFSAIIALAISGVAGFIVYNSDFGLSNDLLYPIISFLVLLGIILLIWKKKLTWFLIVSGILLILANASTDLFYEKGTILGIGILLIFFGLILAWRNSKKNQDNSGSNFARDERRRNKFERKATRKAEKAARKAEAGRNRRTSSPSRSSSQRKMRKAQRKAEKKARKKRDAEDRRNSTPTSSTGKIGWLEKRAQRKAEKKARKKQLKETKKHTAKVQSDFGKRLKARDKKEEAKKRKAKRDEYIKDTKKKVARNAAAAKKRVGKESKRVWAGTLSRGRNMSSGRAEKAAYKERAKRQGVKEARKEKSEREKYLREKQKGVDKDEARREKHLRDQQRQVERQKAERIKAERDTREREARGQMNEAERQKKEEVRRQREHNAKVISRAKKIKAANKEQARRQEEQTRNQKNQRIQNERQEAERIKAEQDARERDAREKSDQARRQQREIGKAQKAANKENTRVNKELRKRYKEIIGRLNSMPAGKNIKKGSPGYNEYISLYREAQNIRKKLRI